VLKDLARGYFKAYENGDIEAVMGFLDRDYVLHPGGGEEPLNYDGRKRDEMVFFAAFSSIEAVVEDQVAEGDQVVSRVTLHCTHSGEIRVFLRLESALRLLTWTSCGSRLERSLKSGLSLT
jgi:predicted ester cyclase